jgi:hypothetical protein
MAQQLQELAHQHPGQEGEKACRSSFCAPVFGTLVVEIDKDAIPDECPLDDRRLVDSVCTPRLLSAPMISISHSSTLEAGPLEGVIC